MCNNPLYRIKIGDSLFKTIPNNLRLRCRGDGDKRGIIIDRIERDTLVNVYGVPDSSICSIPCGRCLACLSDYQAQWTSRAMLEASLYKYNYFVTLTYNDDNIPLQPIINPVTGETRLVNTLVKEDFTAFFKRLRARQAYKGYPSPRFLACGEYGDTTKRCHFHFLGFNLYIDDLAFYYFKGQKGIHFDYQVGDEAYYLSNTLSDLWGKGFILITELTPANCSYVCSYVNKQVTPKQRKLAQGSQSVLDAFNAKFDTPQAVDYAQQLGQLPSSFLHMSRRPGLGNGAFDAKDYYKSKGVKYCNGKRLPKRNIRYFDNLLEKRYPVCLEVLKDYRRKLAYVPRLQWDNCNGYYEQLQRQEDILIEKNKHKKKRDF